MFGESAPKPKSEAEPTSGPEMTRRDFLTFASGAILSGVARTAVQESVVGSERISETTPQTRTSSPEVVPDDKEIPDAEGLLATFNALLGEQWCRETNRKSDEKGVYFWELECKMKGGKAELSYGRKGTFDNGNYQAGKTKIWAVYYDDDGLPEGGGDVAVFENGVWEIKI